MTQSESVSDLLKVLYEIISLENVDLADFYIHDDEDLILFSLHYLINNLDNALDIRKEIIKNGRGNN